MKGSLIKQIEEKLSELLTLMDDEKAYNSFCLDDPIMYIYDKVLQLDEPEGILTDDILERILKLCEAKVNLYKR